MKKLLIPKKVFDQIVSSVLATRDGLETGVTLFGTSLAGIPALDQKTTQPDSGCIVLAIAGPGKRATHQPAHYSGDDGHANEIYDALRIAMPGIRWLGEFHVHPRGMTWLSGGDRRTVKQILKEGLDQQPDLIPSAELEAPYRGGARFRRDPSDLLH